MKNGFTLVELVVTAVLIGMLAAVAIPVYTSLTARANVAASRSDLEAVKTAFANHYYSSLLDGSREFPPAPTDSLMTTAWAAATSLKNGEAVQTLFSEGLVPLNPKGNPYRYGIYSDNSGFVLRDGDFLVFIVFEP